MKIFQVLLRILKDLHEDLREDEDINKDLQGSSNIFEKILKDPSISCQDPQGSWQGCLRFFEDP